MRTQDSNTMLVLIDPQNDFVNGSLAVPGAEEDMDRTTDLINKHGRNYKSIWVSKDSHYHVDISHPACYFKEDGTFIDPFTVLKEENGQILNANTDEPVTVRGGNSKPDILHGLSLQEYIVSYIKALSNSNNGYPLIVWPYHCIVGTPGHNIFPSVREAISQWEIQNYRRFEPVTKGLSFWSEHYGFLKADVQFDGDPTTLLNTHVANAVQAADEIHVGGEAKTHCVLTSLLQLAEVLGPQALHKMVILTDLMSDIPATPTIDFPAIADAEFKRLEGLGVRFARSTDVW
jgi:nicotinamidase-related amidase